MRRHPILRLIDWLGLSRLHQSSGQREIRLNCRASLTSWHQQSVLAREATPESDTAEDLPRRSASPGATKGRPSIASAARARTNPDPAAGGGPFVIIPRDRAAPRVIAAQLIAWVAAWLR